MGMGEPPHNGNNIWLGKIDDIPQKTLRSHSPRTKKNNIKIMNHAINKIWNNNSTRCVNYETVIFSQENQAGAMRTLAPTDGSSSFTFWASKMMSKTKSVEIWISSQRTFVWLVSFSPQPWNFSTCIAITPSHTHTTNHKLKLIFWHFKILLTVHTSLASLPRVGLVELVGEEVREWRTRVGKSLYKWVGIECGETCEVGGVNVASGRLSDWVHLSGWVSVRCMGSVGWDSLGKCDWVDGCVNFVKWNIWWWWRWCGVGGSGAKTNLRSVCVIRLSHWQR